MCVCVCVHVCVHSVHIYIQTLLYLQIFMTMGSCVCAYVCVCVCVGMDVSVIRYVLFASINIMLRVSANGPGDRILIPYRAISKTQKIMFDASLLNNQYYKAQIKGKWNNPGKGIVPSPTPRCGSYWKGNLRVTLYSGRLTYIPTRALPRGVIHRFLLGVLAPNLG